MTRVIIGIGSNLGDRHENVKKAIDLLNLREIISDIKISKIHHSKALLKDDAPKEWNLDYLNLAVSGKTDLTPRKLLSELKRIEEDLGRKNKKEVWSPREIDLDILLFGDLVIEEEDLTIPHKEFLNRDFAFKPANEIHPEWKYPKAGEYLGLSLGELERKLIA